jgi:hypothetical protein
VITLAGSLDIAPVAARHLAPSPIKDDITDKLWIAGRLWRGHGLFDYGSGAVDRVIQMDGVDALHANQTIDRGEILDRKTHKPSVGA